MPKIYVKATNANNPVNLGGGVFVTGKYGREVEKTEAVQKAIANKQLTELTKAEFDKSVAELNEARAAKAKETEAAEAAQKQAEQKKKTGGGRKKKNEDEEEAGGETGEETGETGKEKE